MEDVQHGHAGICVDHFQKLTNTGLRDARSPSVIFCNVAGSTAEESQRIWVIGQQQFCGNGVELSEALAGAPATVPKMLRQAVGQSLLSRLSLPACTSLAAQQSSQRGFAAVTDKGEALFSGTVAFFPAQQHYFMQPTKHM